MILDKGPSARPFTPTYLVFPDGAHWTPGADFTIEAVVSFTATNQLGFIYNHYLASGNQRSLNFFYDGTNTRYGATLSTNGSATVTLLHTATPATDGTKYHVALDRSGTTVRLYVAGAVGDTDTVSGALFNTNRAAHVGASDGGSNPFSAIGRIWAFRMTVGVARYAGAFTPPSLPWPTS